MCFLMSHSGRVAFFWPSRAELRSCLQRVSEPVSRFDLDLDMVGSSNAILTTQLTATERYFALSLALDRAITIAIVLALYFSPLLSLVSATMLYLHINHGFA